MIEDAPLPIYSWSHDLEEGALQQARNCARLPVAHHHVAVMADGHRGYGVPIGAVLALKGAISPYAVGNDIGCGMAVIPTTIEAEALIAERDGIMRDVQRAIPTSGGHRQPRSDDEAESLLADAFDALREAAGEAGQRLSTSQSFRPGKGTPLQRDRFLDKGLSQLGTLGSGNHFLEILADPDDHVWLMVHSGSRGSGALICNNFHRMALQHCEDGGEGLPDPGLAWLPLDDSRWGRVGRCYEQAMNAALNYAFANRRSILSALAAIVETRFPDTVDWDGLVNIHHNDARLEEHFGAPVYVHRKGAVKAAEDVVTVTPGSMGSSTWLGRGRGHPDAYESCSHGAGRAMSRTQAKKRLDLRDQLDQIRGAGGKVYAQNTRAVLDEMPDAYKDLDAVMQAQRDLVEPTVKLTPLATFKGT